MPDSAARLRGNFNRSISEPLFDRIYAVTLSQLEYPDLMDKTLPFKANVGTPTVMKEVKEILSLVSVLTCMDAAVYANAPYQALFYLSYVKNVQQKCEIFGVGGDMIADIYHSAFVKTAYEFQEEIESGGRMRLGDICDYLNDSDGFRDQFIDYLEHAVTLPDNLTTVEELIEHAKEYHSAQAVTQSFVKSVRVIKEFPNYFSCLQCWVCGATETKNCSACKVAAFCGRPCLRKAWKKNHKVHCFHYKRVMDYVERQCRRIEQALMESFLAPGISLLQPNQFFDYTMVCTQASFIAQDPGASLQEDTVSINNFYKNLLQVEKDDSAFRNLFKRGTKVDNNAAIHSLVNVCVSLMYNGSPPQTLPFPKVTRNTFLKKYKDASGFVKQSEEMVKASVIEDLKAFFTSEDYSQLSVEEVNHRCQEVKKAGI